MDSVTKGKDGENTKEEFTKLAPEPRHSKATDHVDRGSRMYPVNYAFVSDEIELDPLTTASTSSKLSDTDGANNPRQGSRLGLDSHASVRTLDVTAQTRFRAKKRSRIPAVKESNTEDGHLLANKSVKSLQAEFARLHRSGLEEKNETVELSSFEKKWKRWKRNVGEIVQDLELWRGSMKTVYSHFGSSVVAYFKFVRWLFLLNLVTFLVVLATVVLPQALLTPAAFADSLPSDDLLSAPQLLAQNCSAQYLARLDADYSGRDLISVYVLDVLHGTGWMENTLLFMGFYFDKNSETFLMPLAYILVAITCMLLSLWVMVGKTSGSIKERMVTRGGQFYPATTKVFCGWDFAISEENAANFQHLNIYKEYKADHVEAARRAARERRTRGATLALYAARTCMWLLTLGVWGGSIYLIYLVVAVWMPQLLQQEAVASNSWLLLLAEFLPSLTMTAISTIFPLLFAGLVAIEDYGPEGALMVTLVRCVVLRFLAIGVLVLTLVGQLLACGADQRRPCGVCPGFPTPQSPSLCWETYVGQQFYKLVILDFIVVLFLTLFLELPRMLAVKLLAARQMRLARAVGYQQFDLLTNVLMIVYSQTLCWLGAFFSPIIPGITMVKFFIFFYVKKCSLLNLCVPAEKHHRASRSEFFFVVILLFSFLVSVIFIALAIGMIPPSRGCGPFRVYLSDSFYMAHAISDLLVARLPNLLRETCRFVWSTGVMVILIIVVGLLIGLFCAISAGSQSKIKMLEQELAMIGKDKQFLLQQVNEVLKRRSVKSEI